MQNLEPFWLMWWIQICVRYNLDFNTGDIWRSICESMPDAGFCWLDGCENSLAGYKWNAMYCCPEHYNSDYYHILNGEYFTNYRKVNREHRLAESKRWNREHQEKRKAYATAYYQANKERLKAKSNARYARKKAEKAQA